MSIDFTKMPGTTNPQGVPSWLDPLFGIKKTAATKTAQVEGEGADLDDVPGEEGIKKDDLFDEKPKVLDKEPELEEECVDDGDELTKEDIEGMLMKNDPMSKVKHEEDVEPVMASRIDPVIRPYSRAAQEKIAAHWGGDTPEEIKKAEGEVVNDGDKVRDVEESKFEAEAANTTKRLVDENKPRNSIWEVTEGKKSEASAKGQVKTASTNKFASLDDDEKALWKDFYKAAFDYATKEGKEDVEKIAESYAWIKIAKAKEDPEKMKKAKEKEKEAKKKEAEKKKAEEAKAKEKAKKEKEKAKDKKEKKAETDDEREQKLALRSYRRNQLLNKVAKKEDEGYGAHKTDVQFEKSWYDEIVGDKKNIGKVREAEVEAGVEKEASVDVGLDFGSDPKATGEYGASGDFKVNDVYDENADVMKGDVESEPLDDANYSKEYGTTRKSSDERMSKSAHYNNRTWGMDDDGPTAPAQQDDGRDTFLRTWWTDQVKKSEQFLDKEYKILGDGKKITHMDAIPVFKDKASKEAFITNRRMKREAIVGKAAGDQSDKSYYADAYGDTSYAAQQVANYGEGKVKKAETIEERAALRNKIAGVDNGIVKEAQAIDPALLQTILANPAAKTALATAALAVPPPFGEVLAAAVKLGAADKILGAINNMLPAVKGPFAAKIQELAKTAQPAAGGAAPAAGGAAPAPATASNDLQIRKEARNKIAQTYGEPVQEPDSDAVGNYDWDASDLTRNAIVDAPQAAVIKQLEQSINNVRGALKGKK